MPTEVTIHEAKTHLSRLVQRAHAGEDIVIRRDCRRCTAIRSTG